MPARRGLKLKRGVTRQEHESILTFLEATLHRAVEPLDVEADAIIRAYFKRHPDAAYHVTKLAMALSAPLQVDAPKRRGWFSALRARHG
mgnify:CR=1 FL=1